MTNKNEIKELCKEHDIDIEIVESFMKETGAYPFLLGEPSSYLLFYIEKEKKIDMKFKTKEIISVTSIKFENEGNGKTCEKCNEDVSDFVTIEKIKSESEKETHLYCINCALKSKLNEIKISEKEFNEYVQRKINDKDYDTPIYTVLMLLFSIGNEENEKTTELRNEIIFGKEYKNKKEIEIMLSEIVKRTSIYRSIPLYNDEIVRSVDLVEEREKIKKDKNYPKRNPYEYVTIIEKERYYGSMIAPWLMNEKIKKSVQGFVISVVNETQKAILCNYCLLDGNRRFHDWIPKSQLNKDGKFFRKKILLNSLENMNIKLT